MFDALILDGAAKGNTCVIDVLDVLYKVDYFGTKFVSKWCTDSFNFLLQRDGTWFSDALNRVRGLGPEFRVICDERVTQIVREFLAAFVLVWRSREGAVPVELVEQVRQTPDGLLLEMKLRFWWAVDEPVELVTARQRFEKIDRKRTQALSDVNKLREQVITKKMKQ